MGHGAGACAARKGCIQLCIGNGLRKKRQTFALTKIEKRCFARVSGHRTNVYIMKKLVRKSSDAIFRSFGGLAKMFAFSGASPGLWDSRCRAWMRQNGPTGRKPCSELRNAVQNGAKQALSGTPGRCPHRSGLRKRLSHILLPAFGIYASPWNKIGKRNRA